MGISMMMAPQGGAAPSHVPDSVLLGGGEIPAVDSTVDVTVPTGVGVGTLNSALEIARAAGGHTQINLMVNVDNKVDQTPTFEGNASNHITIEGNSHTVYGRGFTLDDFDFVRSRNARYFGGAPNSSANFAVRNCNRVIIENCAGYLNHDGNFEFVNVPAFIFRNNISAYPGSDGQGILSQNSSGRVYNNAFHAHYRPLWADLGSVVSSRNIYYDYSGQWAAVRNTNYDSIEDLVIGGPTRDIPFNDIDVNVAGGAHSVYQSGTTIIDSSSNLVGTPGVTAGATIRTTPQDAFICGDSTSDLLTSLNIGPASKSCLDNAFLNSILTRTRPYTPTGVNVGDSLISQYTWGSLGYNPATDTCDGSTDFQIAFREPAVISGSEFDNNIFKLRQSGGQNAIASSDTMSLAFFGADDYTQQDWIIPGITYGQSVDAARVTASGGDLILGGLFTDKGVIKTSRRGMLVLNMDDPTKSVPAYSFT